MEYNVKTVYNQEDFIAINKAWLYKKKPIRILQVNSKVIFGIKGGFLIFVGDIGIFYSIRGLITSDSTMPAVSMFFSTIYTILGILLILRSDSKRLGKIAWKRYKEKGDEIAFSFCSDHFMVQTPISEHRLSYLVVKSICEDEKRYYLFITNNEAHTINKADLGLDDSKQFGRFISEKTGLGIVQIK